MKHAHQEQRKTYVAIILAVLSIALAACSSSGAEVIGRWEEKGGDKERIEFFEDGKLHIENKPKRASLSGTWKSVDGGRIRVEFTYVGTNFSAFVTVSGKTMKLDMGGRVSEYERMP